MLLKKYEIRHISFDDFFHLISSKTLEACIKLYNHTKDEEKENVNKNANLFTKNYNVLLIRSL